MPTFAEAIEFVKDIGLPYFLLIAGAWYFAPLLKKFIESQIGLVETLKTEQPKITSILQKQAETDERHVATSERLCASHDNAIKILESIQDAVKQKPGEHRRDGGE